MKAIEHFLEVLIFNSRWLLAPFYLGLVASIAMLMVVFGREFFHIVPDIFTGDIQALILSILSLVDLSLVANLLIIIIFSGYENFVSKIDTRGHQDRPDWMGKVDFSGLKVKVIGSIMAISAIELLKSFVNAESVEDRVLAWKVVIHVTLVFSGVMFAWMDKIAEGAHTVKHTREQAGH